MAQRQPVLSRCLFAYQIGYFCVSDVIHMLSWLQSFNTWLFENVSFKCIDTARLENSRDLCDSGSFTFI